MRLAIHKFTFQRKFSIGVHNPHLRYYYANGEASKPHPILHPPEPHPIGTYQELFDQVDIHLAHALSLPTTLKIFPLIYIQ